MVRLPPILTMLGALALLPACPGQGLMMELGEQCWDSKDNDQDGQVDCKDPDCAPLGICTLRLDSGVPDKAMPPPKKDSGIKQDKKAPKDVRPPSPDKNLTYSYGRKCVYDSRNRFCPDGRSHCIIGLKGSRAYCTRPCARLGDLCPGGPGGSFAACLYKFNGQPYCSFLCKLQGKGYKCPVGFGCHPWTSSQSYCWP